MSNIETLYYDSTWLGYYYDIIFNHDEKSIKFNMWVAPFDVEEICESINSYVKDNYSDVSIIDNLYYIFSDEAEYNRFYFEHA